MALTEGSKRRYPPELRERATRMALDAIDAQGGQRFGVADPGRKAARGRPGVVRQWVRQAEIDGGSRSGVSTAEAQRIAEKLEARELRAAPRQRHLEGGIGFLRDRARRSSEEVAEIVAFIDARPRQRDRWASMGGRADLCGVADRPHYLPVREVPAVSARGRGYTVLLPILVALWTANYSVYGRRKLTSGTQSRPRHRPRPGRPADGQAGIRGASPARKRFTTHADPAAQRAPDRLHRDFTATRPNEKWVADFTYCSTWSGVVYVAFVIDVYARGASSAGKRPGR